MKILHISTASTWRGGERQTYFLVDGQLKIGHSVSLMTPLGSALSQKCSSFNIEYVNFKKGAIGLVKNIRKLSNYVRDNKIDIVHGHDSHAHTLIWLSYKYGTLNAKSVVTRRLANPIKTKSIGKYNYAKIESIICVSQSVQRTLLPNIESVDRLRIIYSGIDLLKEKNILKSRDYYPITIGYVAAFSKEKDHLTFINAAKLLLKDNKSLRFLLVGDGDLLEEIKSLVSGCESNFEFTGFVNDVGPFYKRMDILMHTSQAEALGTSIIDALQYSLPVVASDVGGINEIISHKKNGLLAQANSPDSFYDLVTEILRDKDLYHDLSVNAHDSVVKFDKSIMIERTQDLYFEIMGTTLQND